MLVLICFYYICSRKITPLSARNKIINIIIKTFFLCLLQGQEEQEILTSIRPSLPSHHSSLYIKAKCCDIPFLYSEKTVMILLDIIIFFEKLDMMSSQMDDFSAQSALRRI